jgi:hypothetical protein
MSEAAGQGPIIGTHNNVQLVEVLKGRGSTISAWQLIPVQQEQADVHSTCAADVINTAVPATSCRVVHRVCRYTREAEAAAAAEDERRKAAVKASSKVLAASLAEQLVLKESLKHAHDGEEQVRRLVSLLRGAAQQFAWTQPG